MKIASQRNAKRPIRVFSRRGIISQHSQHIAGKCMRNIRHNRYELWFIYNDILTALNDNAKKLSGTKIFLISASGVLFSLLLVMGLLGTSVKIFPHKILPWVDEVESQMAERFAYHALRATGKQISAEIKLELESYAKKQAEFIADYAQSNIVPRMESALAPVLETESHRKKHGEQALENARQSRRDGAQQMAIIYYLNSITQNPANIAAYSEYCDYVLQSATSPNSYEQIQTMLASAQALSSQLMLVVAPEHVAEVNTQLQKIIETSTRLSLEEGLADSQKLKPDAQLIQIALDISLNDGGFELHRQKVSEAIEQLEILGGERTPEQDATLTTLHEKLSFIDFNMDFGRRMKDISHLHERIAAEPSVENAKILLINTENALSGMVLELENISEDILNEFTALQEHHKKTGDDLFARIDMQHIVNIQKIEEEMKVEHLIGEAEKRQPKACDNAIVAIYSIIEAIGKEGANLLTESNKKIISEKIVAYNKIATALRDKQVKRYEEYAIKQITDMHSYLKLKEENKKFLEDAPDYYRFTISYLGDIDQRLLSPFTQNVFSEIYQLYKDKVDSMEKRVELQVKLAQLPKKTFQDF